MHPIKILMHASQKMILQICKYAYIKSTVKDFLHLQYIHTYTCDTGRHFPHKYHTHQGVLELRHYNVDIVTSQEWPKENNKRTNNVKYQLMQQQSISVTLLKRYQNVENMSTLLYLQVIIELSKLDHHITGYYWQGEVNLNFCLASCEMTSLSLPP